MRLVRRWAVGVSEFVVRRASPRAKEWAEGLAHEVEFVEGDWGALGWAIGSVRVLFQNPPKLLRNPAEIARAGRMFAGSREHTPPVLSLLMALQAFTNGLRAVLPIGRIGHLERVGFAIATVSAAYLALVGWMDARMSERPEDMDDGAWIEFYRREMVRLRDLYAVFGALYRSAIVLMFAGMVLGYGGMVRMYAASCLIAVWVLVWLSPRPAERFQRKVDDLDSILQRGGREA
jgi:hypothetical protein